MKNILVIDNYDSFTYNLVHYLEDLDCKVNVFRNDQIELKAIAAYDKIVLSPGPGIPEDQYKNVFKPFFRLDKSRSLNKSGVGLGLAIVEDIINSHGGTIQLSKSKMNGLQVKISLPF